MTKKKNLRYNLHCINIKSVKHTKTKCIDKGTNWVKSFKGYSQKHFCFEIHFLAETRSFYQFSRGAFDRFGVWFHPSSPIMPMFVGFERSWSVNSNNTQKSDILRTADIEAHWKLKIKYTFRCRVFWWFNYFCLFNSFTFIQIISIIFKPKRIKVVGGSRAIGFFIISTVPLNFCT